MRSLIESEHYSQCCLKIESDAPRLDQALRYVLFAIAEGAEAFPAVPETPLRRVRTNDFPGAPALLLFFAIDDDTQCTLWSLELLPTPPELRAAPPGVPLG